LKSLLRRLPTGFALGALAAIVATLLTGVDPFQDFFQRVENSSYDWRVRQTATPVPADSPIVIVDINESSVREMAKLVGRWPWPRLVHSSAVDYIALGGAKVIAYDVLFLEREGRSQTEINGQQISGAQSDDALVTSVKSAGNVILLADTSYEGLASDKNGPRSTAILPGTVYEPGEGFQSRTLQMPFAELAGVAIGIGHNYVERDEGSDFARWLPPFIDASGVAAPGLGMAAALAYVRPDPHSVVLKGDVLQVGARRMPLVRQASADGKPGNSTVQSLLRFSEPVTRQDGSRSVFTTYSFFDVLVSADQVASGKPPAIPASAFAGKLVFIGTSAAGTFDSYATPFEKSVPGVELHATLAENVLSGRFMRRAPRSHDLVVIGAAALVAGLLAVLLPAVWATAGVVVLAAGLLWTLTRAVGDGIWAAAVAPTLGIGLALFGGVTWQYLVEGRGKREMRKLFGRYVSKDVIDQLVSDPGMARLGGTRREMTVLFSDIRGFTTATEQGQPEAVVLQLNEHFSHMVEVLFRHKGTVDKFVGDMVMGLFGAPVPDPDHAEHAVQAALAMVARLDKLNAGWRAAGKPTLDIGVGVNTGEMIAGNIGSEAIMSYTVIGDAVNLGSRLESLNKDYGTRILISQSTKDQLRTPVPTRLIGPVVVKGRTQPVVVYEVLTTESRT
jgi:adenylate cyclase